MDSVEFPWIEEESDNPIDKEMLFKKTDIFRMESETLAHGVHPQSGSPERREPQSMDANPNNSLTALALAGSETDDARHDARDSAEYARAGGSDEERQINRDVPQDSDYTNLALKYRPKIFGELVGQDSISQTLSLALESRKISHAYLFSGIRGSGKTSSARMFARCLQCQMGISSRPCDECDSCRAALNMCHMDIIELDAASNRGIDDIRDIIDQTKYNPVQGRFKIFIIDEAHMLTNQAFNALLKTLEEPPEYIKFIFATTDPMKIPVTILSRVQHFRFKRVHTNKLKEHIINILSREAIVFEDGAIDMIIRNGQGSVRDTITLLEQAAIYCKNNITTRALTDMLGSLDPSTFDDLFEALQNNDKKACLEFVNGISQHDAQTVIDELSAYVKNKILEGSIDMSLGVEYAEVLTNAKYMINNDFDEGFCIMISVIRMLISTNTPKNTSAHIQPVEKPKSEKPTIHRIMDSAPARQVDGETKQVEHGRTHVDTSRGPAQVTKAPAQGDTKAKESSSTITSKSQVSAQSVHKGEFELLVSKLYNREYVLGEIVEKHVTIVTLQDNVLCLDFYTDEKQTQTLRDYYSVFMQCIRDVFGSNTKIKVDKKGPKRNEDVGIEKTSHANHTRQGRDGPTPNTFQQQNKDMIRLIQDELGISKTGIVDGE